MTGFRIGWVITSRRLVAVMNNVQAQTTSCPSVVSQAAAEGALTGVQSIIENLRLTIQNNRDVMMQELESFDGVKVHKPSGTFYCLPDFRAYSGDSVELAKFLLEKALVVKSAIDAFGAARFAERPDCRANIGIFESGDFARKDGSIAPGITFTSS